MKPPSKDFWEGAESFAVSIGLIIFCLWALGVFDTVVCK